MTAITSSGASETDRARKQTSGCFGLTASITASTTTAGHVDVEQHDVGQPLGDQLDGGRDLVGLPDDLDGVAELAADPGAEEMVVVDEEDRWLVGGAHCRPGLRGTLSSTSVPSPGTERMTAVPPWRCIRPRIDSAMPLRSPAIASGSNPAPRSRMNMDTRFGSAST